MALTVILIIGVIICFIGAVKTKYQLADTLLTLGAVICLLLTGASFCPTNWLYDQFEMEEVIEEEQEITTVPSSNGTSFTEEISVGKNRRPATVFYVKTSDGVEKYVTEDKVVFKDTATGTPFVKVCHFAPKTIWGKIIVNPFAVRNDTTVFYMPL